MRIVILYAYNWHNIYFDQVVLVLTTLDPLINHCVCLWTMRKYRDGYASSLGKVFSCFKPSEEGMFRSAITRISSMSRRSFSRSSSSARSSSMRTSRRKSCKCGIDLYLITTLSRTRLSRTQIHSLCIRGEYQIAIWYSPFPRNNFSYSLRVRDSGSQL